MGDFNNDGYPDLFLGNAVQSELYKNNGNGWTNYYQQDFKKDHKRIKEKNKSKKVKKDE